MPGLEAFVRARTAHYDRAYLSADPSYTHAHVTVLGPFLPAVDDAATALVAKVVASVEPFAFRLDRLATYPNGCVHLKPEPDEGFRELTRRLWAAFPECPPYAGEHPRSTPHLTLDLVHGEVTEASTRALLARPEYARPARHRAERVDLAWYQAGGCRLLDSWPLGSG